MLDLLSGLVSSGPLPMGFENVLPSVEFLTQQGSGSFMRPATHIVSDIGALTRLVLILSTIVGIVVFFFGIHFFVRMSKEPGRHAVGTGLRTIATGVFLTTPASLYSIFMGSATGGEWQHSRDALMLNPGAIAQTAGGLANSFLGRYLPGEVLTAVLAVLFLLGLLFFVNGIYEGRNIGQNNGQGPTVTGVCVRLVVGMVLMNPVASTTFVIGIFFNV